MDKKRQKSIYFGGSKSTNKRYLDQWLSPEFSKNDPDNKYFQALMGLTGLCNILYTFVYCFKSHLKDILRNRLWSVFSSCPIVSSPWTNHHPQLVFYQLFLLTFIVDISPSTETLQNISHLVLVITQALQQVNSSSASLCLFPNFHKYICIAIINEKQVIKGIYGKVWREVREGQMM